jgi:hypothetical protein
MPIPKGAVETGEKGARGPRGSAWVLDEAAEKWLAAEVKKVGAGKSVLLSAKQAKEMFGRDEMPVDPAGAINRALENNYPKMGVRCGYASIARKKVKRKGEDGKEYESNVVSPPFAEQPNARLAFFAAGKKSE